MIVGVQYKQSFPVTSFQGGNATPPPQDLCGLSPLSSFTLSIIISYIKYMGTIHDDASFVVKVNAPVDGCDTEEPNLPSF